MGVWTRIRRITVIALLVGLHLFTRLHANATMPLNERHIYPSSYLVSLSILSGNGFAYLWPRDASPDLGVDVVVDKFREDPGPSGRVMDFIATPGLRDPSWPVRRGGMTGGRHQLSRADLASFISSGAHPLGLGHGAWESSRVFDLYLAAALWQCFGISWSVLFAFYAVVSALCCLLVFLIARQLSGSYWCGVVGAAGFLASPLENYLAVFSFRDASPLWFAALSFFVLLRFWEPLQSWLATCLRWIALGFLSLLGLGWRADAQILSPFILVALVTLLAISRCSPRRIGVAVICFVTGCLGLKGLVGWLGPGEEGQGIFPIAWYGEHARSILLGSENAFQAVQRDEMTLYQANYFGRSRSGSEEGFSPSRDVTDPAFFRRCRSMYLEMAMYNAYNWWSSFPRFLLTYASRVDRPVMPTAAVHGGDTGTIRWVMDRRVEWLGLVHRWLLDPYRSCVPYLFGVGIVAALAQRERRVLVLSLPAFFAYYSACLMLVLPEANHWAQLLLPLHVLAALGLCSLVRAALSGRRLAQAAVQRRRQLLASTLAVGLLATGWILVGVVAYGISRSQRARFVNSILSRVPSGEESRENLQGDHLFSVKVAPRDANRPFGYLLRIKAGKRALDLLCVHVREATAHHTPLSYWTRHRVQPQREQFFFVNPVTGTGIGHDRPYTLFVRVWGGTRLVSYTKVDLAGWNIGLPLSFVFQRDDRNAGSPLIGDYGLPATSEGPETSDAVEAWLGS